jgi:hypothetical protein
MSELDYIGSNELVFNNNTADGIHSGGFSVNSIMMKSGMSPIMTINNEQFGGKSNKVSDLFNDLVVPNWTLSYNNRIIGGNHKDVEHGEDSEDEDVVDDELHDKLLELVKHHQHTKPIKKKTRKFKNVSKKGLTKKRK